MLIIFGVGLMIFGLLDIVAKDFIWKLTVLSLKLQGINAERTPFWYILQNAIGVVCIILSSVMSAMAFGIL